MTEPQSGPFGESGQPDTSAGGGLDPSGERFASHDERYQHPAGAGGTGAGGMSAGGTRTGGMSAAGPTPGGASASSTSAGSASAGSTSAGGTRTGGMSAGSTSAGSAGTTTRRPAARQRVPQQYGRASDRGIGYERGEGEYQPGMGPDDGRRTGLGVGGGLIAAAAGRAWPVVAAGGLGLLALGIMLLVWPRESLTLVAILIGAALVVSGVVRLFEGFAAHRESAGMRAAYVVIGLLAILAGIFLLRHHVLSLFLVSFVTGVYFIAHGISDLGVAFSGQAPARGLRGVLGLFSIAAGILMVVWPAITLILLLTLVAAWLMFYGLVMCGIAASLMRVSRVGREHARGGPRAGRLAASAR